MCPPCPNHHSNLFGQLELYLDNTSNIDSPSFLTAVTTGPRARPPTTGSERPQ
ncbi:BZ3500_MvSof-1268-A1-R1_Chr11-1g03117 [Microbotryum saponariae]|uniref:BZ3500_MvSof-1268-A1-R1_Chr11-1g03117 protein n=1 Tax=Microbotryum saponariae TaxID=289078 RepID=A0A2X0NEY3_9BASI|nr:BZ3501_MvSof-1269-A2-R1_Chr11g02692 [Microbotryum saponariae]SDA03677.1 BZ3500_MvSof-1268-A1-R1_Chr11-1g03117 [Microbotryum saponariae]